MAFILAILLIKPLGFSNEFLLHFLCGFFAISLKKESLVLMRNNTKKTKQRLLVLSNVFLFFN